MVIIIHQPSFSNLGIIITVHNPQQSLIIASNPQYVYIYNRVFLVDGILEVAAGSRACSAPYPNGRVHPGGQLKGPSRLWWGGVTNEHFLGLRKPQPPHGFCQVGMLNHLELNKNIIMQLGTRIILNFLLLRSFVPKPFSSTGLSRSRTKNWTLTAMTALESGARRSRRNQRGLENVPGAFAAFPTGVNNLAPTSSGYIIL